MIFLLVLLLGFALMILRRAWVCDDAYITFRTSVHLAQGYGPRWNVAERVQSYTNPLWMLCMAAAYALTGDVFYTGIALGLLLTLAAAWQNIRIADSFAAAAWGILALACSNAVLDYATSGLENALTHFLLAVFAVCYFRCSLSFKSLFCLALVAALGMLNRLDVVWLYAPPLGYALWRWWRARHSLPAGLIAVGLGQLPLWLWEGFSLVYYGFLFPNTAYAKLNTAIPAGQMIEQGLAYLVRSWRYDPLILTLIGGGLFLTLFRPSDPQLDRPLAWGLLLQLVYLVRIGGDFANGRFLTAPLWVAVLLLLRQDWKRLGGRAIAAAVGATILIGALAVHPTFLFSRNDFGAPDNSVFIDDQGIADERMWYAATNSLIGPLRDASHSVPRAADLPAHGWRYDGMLARQLGRRVVTTFSIGMFGFYAGSQVYVIDLYALADPLLARLPALHNEHWRIGHFTRALPEGYVETLLSGQNQIADAALGAYYDRLALITRGPLFDPQRWVAIWQINTGQYDRWIDQDAYRYPKMAYVKLNQLSGRTASVVPWFDAGTVFFYDGGLEIELARPSDAFRIEMSVRGSPAYELRFLRGQTVQAVQTLRAEQPWRWQTLSLNVPAAARAAGYDRIQVFSQRPGQASAIWHIRLE